MIGWAALPIGTLKSDLKGCVSAEAVDVTGQGAIARQQSWRLFDCVLGAARTGSPLAAARR